MTKKEVAWLLIRLAGVLLLWQAIAGAVTLVNSYLFVSENAELLSRSGGVFWQMILLMLINLAFGLYCVFGGSVLFQILDSENVDSSQEHISIIDLHK